MAVESLRNSRMNHHSNSSNSSRMSRIRSATIVILLTPSSGSTGKSSTEDYRDFEEIHIEPDRDDDNNDYEVQQHQETNRKSVLDELSRKALEAADRCDNPKVVVRYVTNTSSQDCCQQESLVQRLIEGGASHENITVVRHAMDQYSNQKHRSGLSFYRTKYCTWRPKAVVLA